MKCHKCEKDLTLFNKRLMCNREKCAPLLAEDWACSEWQCCKVGGHATHEEAERCWQARVDRDALDKAKADGEKPLPCPKCGAPGWFNSFPAQEWKVKCRAGCKAWAERRGNWSYCHESVDKDFNPLPPQPHLTKAEAIACWNAAVREWKTKADSAKAEEIAYWNSAVREWKAKVKSPPKIPGLMDETQALKRQLKALKIDFQPGEIIPVKPKESDMLKENEFLMQECEACGREVVGWVEEKGLRWACPCGFITQMRHKKFAKIRLKELEKARRAATPRKPSSFRKNTFLVGLGAALCYTALVTEKQYGWIGKCLEWVEGRF